MEIAEVGWTTEFDFSVHGEEESEEMMAQLLGNSFPSSHGEGGHQELPWCYQAPGAYCDGNGGSLVVGPAAYEGCYLSNSNAALGISSSDDLGGLVQDHGAADFLNVFPNHSFSVYENGNGSLNQVDLDDPGMSGVDSACAANKRKHLVADELDHQTRARKRARKCEAAKGPKKAGQSGDENADATLITSGSPTSCCTSDDSIDSNASRDCADARPRTKARAGRGAATEPQSIYARKRRERINERLKILQNLVPNGTKVDISTMLEEAVHYVKFLQLQIKLLSSDDTWMFAPIAYNGMNVGAHLNIAR